MPRARRPTTGGAPPAIELADQLPKLTLRQLSYFLAAANHQSVRKAAQSLHVSAPSVSMAIAQIETIIATQLFVRRHARGLVLTDAGRDLAVSARNMLAYAREIETVRGGAATYSGRLNIGCLLTVAPFFIPPLLSGFAESYPHTRMRWQEGNHESSGRGARNGRARRCHSLRFRHPEIDPLHAAANDAATESSCRRDTRWRVARLSVR